MTEIPHLGTVLWIIAERSEIQWSGCLIWTGTMLNDTPIFTAGEFCGRSIRRIVFAAKTGRMPRYPVICDCGNSRCISPDHVFERIVGNRTGADQDRQAGKFGAALTDSQHEAVMQMRGEGLLQREIAVSLGVSQSTISRLLREAQK